MKRRTLAVAVLLYGLGSLATIAQPQQQTPSQVALQITNIVGQWAQAIEALQKQNADLQAQLVVITKERDELKAKEHPPTAAK